MVTTPTLIMGLKHVFWLQLLKQPSRAIPAAITIIQARTASEGRQHSNDRRKRVRAKGRSRQDARGRKTKSIFSPPSAWYAFNRKKSMNVDKISEETEWSSVYQVSRPFDPFLIPLPIRMGRPGPGEVPPVAIGNHELLKIPNFFHLTPPAIEKHCAALKPLCTPWPDKLPCLPLRFITKNYVFPSTNIRHTGARIVKMSVTLSDIPLADRARQKMILLAGKHYDATTDQLTLIGNKCPTRKQNKEYVLYLLKVLYIEANKFESWESDELPASIISQ